MKKVSLFDADDEADEALRAGDDKEGGTKNAWLKVNRQPKTKRITACRLVSLLLLLLSIFFCFFLMWLVACSKEYLMEEASLCVQNFCLLFVRWPW